MFCTSSEKAFNTKIAHLTIGSAMASTNICHFKSYTNEEIAAVFTFLVQNYPLVTSLIPNILYNEF
jgi:hypothetical protein